MMIGAAARQGRRRFAKVTRTRPAITPDAGTTTRRMSQFKERVLAVIEAIPEGKVLSYGAVAILAGRPRAARGVGSVLSAHGETLPWWRVIQSTGAIAGRPTARLQRSLLEAEGVRFVDDRVDLDLFGWVPSSAGPGTNRRGPDDNARPSCRA